MNFDFIKMDVKATAWNKTFINQCNKLLVYNVTDKTLCCIAEKIGRNFSDYACYYGFGNW